MLPREQHPRTLTAGRVRSRVELLLSQRRTLGYRAPTTAFDRELPDQAAMLDTLGVPDFMPFILGDDGFTPAYSTTASTTNRPRPAGSTLAGRPKVPSCRPASRVCAPTR